MRIANAIKRGGVVLLAINADRKEAYSLNVAAASERYTLTSHELTGKQIQLNGSDLKLGAGDALPELKPVAVRAGKVTVAPESITFLVMPKASNGACQK